MSDNGIAAAPDARIIFRGNALAPDVTDACRIKAAPTPEHPKRAMVRTYWAHAVFESPEEAATWSSHPGDLPRMVAAYLEWAKA